MFTARQKEYQKSVSEAPLFICINFDFNLLTPVTVGFLQYLSWASVLVLLETSITKGFRAAVAFDLGVIIADTCFILICYLGSFQLLKMKVIGKASSF